MLRRVLVVALACGALLGVPLGFSASGDEADLGGYDMTATATAVSFIYNQRSFGLPTDPTFELRKVHATATADSGPSGRALSSVVWPGDAAGNADPALILDLVMFDPTRDSTPDDGGYLSPYLSKARESIKAGVGDGCKDRNCTYPLRAEAFFPASEGHPSSATYPAGGVVDMTAGAREGRSDATTVTKEAGVDGGFFVGAMTSRAVTEVKRGIATAVAMTHLEDVSLLGLVSFGSIDTVAQVTSDGKAAKPVTSVSVTSMSIDAQCRQPGADQKACRFPIFVDEAGLHAGKDPAQDPTGGQARKYIDEYLVPQGFDIVVTPASTRADKDAAQGFGAVSGLVIRMDATGMGKLIDAIPDENVKTWLRSPSSKDSPLKPLFNFFSPTVAGYATSMTQGDQVMSIVLGDASVDAAAAPGYSLDTPEIDFPIDNGGVGIPVSGGGDFGGGFTGGPETPPASGAPVFFALVPVAVKGVADLAGGFIVLIGMLSAIALRRYADRVTLPATRDVCPLEVE